MPSAAFPGVSSLTKLLFVQVGGRLRTNQRKRANQLRRMIERLGPAYVKVAQVLRLPRIVASTSTSNAKQGVELDSYALRVLSSHMNLLSLLYAGSDGGSRRHSAREWTS